MTNTITYKALALQLHCAAINHVEGREAQQAHLVTGIDMAAAKIKASKQFIGRDLKLVVLPEYFLTGFPMGESIAEWQQKACVQNNDVAYRLLQQYAKELDIYISGNWYELDEHFPGLYFQTSFIISDAGATILRYRRLNSMFAPTPHDVLSEYLRIYGQESLFPVVDTPLGKLACVASEEILYPEIARCLALNGAEVLLHSSSEVSSPMATQKNVAKLARTTENMAYVVSANSAGISGTHFPANSTDGHSQIVNYEGLKLCEAATGESMVANATIDIAALRQARQRPGMSNFLSRQRLELFAPVYNRSVYPANTLLNKKADRKHFMEQQQEVIAMLRQKGIIA
jgi:deaminated glutathione amidase